MAGLDFPNSRWRPDYDLNVYPFVSSSGEAGDIEARLAEERMKAREAH